MMKFRVFRNLLRSDLDFGLLLLACAVLVLALLHPHARLEQDAFDFLVVVDITQSMNTLDYQQESKPVSRLVFVKQALEQALLRLPCGSKIGLGIFTEYRSFVLFEPVEICANYREISTTLADIDERMAWVGSSEISKGLYSGLRTVRSLLDLPALVFITDGQEAPPVNPHHRPVFDGKPGEAKGVIIGAGGLVPMPIPKFDPDGRPLGYWRADEVLQTDPYSLGRSTSVKGEKMVETEKAPIESLGATPGSEQLSSLREPYLKLLAKETGLAYRRLGSPADLTAALEDHDLAQQQEARVGIAWIPALIVLFCLLMVYGIPAGYRSTSV
jgi:mxaL protein